MRPKHNLQWFSKQTPTILILSLAAALMACWAGAPLWVPYGLATAQLALALTLMASRDRRRTRVEADARVRDWLADELDGHGSPRGTYPLGFVALVTLALTGFEGAYALPAWAALALIAAWAVANARAAPTDRM